MPDSPLPPKVVLADKLALFDERWTPKIVGATNGQLVKRQETHLLLIEPASTAHTGKTVTARTVPLDAQEWI